MGADHSSGLGAGTPRSHSAWVEGEQLGTRRPPLCLGSSTISSTLSCLPSHPIPQGPQAGGELVLSPSPVVARGHHHPALQDGKFRSRSISPGP